MLFGGNPTLLKCFRVVFPLFPVLCFQNKSFVYVYLPGCCGGAAGSDPPVTVQHTRL